MAQALARVRRGVWTWALPFGVVSLFLLFDATGKVLRVPPVVEGTVQLGFEAGAVLWIGLLELACLVVYAIPRTSVVGAVLLTGYLGGAVATHVRLGSPLLSHVLFPVYVAGILWLALLLREPGVRRLLGSPSGVPTHPAS